jgi:phytanoyl-CoA dioxygenase PhyH
MLRTGPKGQNRPPLPQASLMAGSSMLLHPDDVRSIDQRGFALTSPVLEPVAIDQLLAELSPIKRADATHRTAPLYAIRNLTTVIPLIRTVAHSEPLRHLVEPILGLDAFPVQALFFDKPPHANWKVPWHQDLTVPVRARVEVPGFGPWSMKDGVSHVQPPRSVLERMLIVRLHLDGCTEENGPLRVIPGSHRQGRLSPTQIERRRLRGQETLCLAPRGGALIMRPLLLHASSAALKPDHRRVIHLEYAAERLPGGLSWAVDAPLEQVTSARSG